MKSGFHFFANGEEAHHELLCRSVRHNKKRCRPIADVICSRLLNYTHLPTIDVKVFLMSFL